MNRGPFTQEVWIVYTCPFLDRDELKLALRARKVSGAVEKRAPGPARFRTPITEMTIATFGYNIYSQISLLKW